MKSLNKILIEPVKVRDLILRVSNASGHGHIPTSFSIIEMVLAAYQSMKHDPEKPELLDRDIFILSKGHANCSLNWLVSKPLIFGYLVY